MIKRLDWDSNFFNLKIGEIIYDENYKEIDISDYDLIYGVSNEDFQLKLSGFENTFSETKIIFIKSPKADIPISESIFKLDEAIIDRKELYLLAYESGKNSRFFLDKKFDEKHFKKLYRAWIDNSISKKIADEVLVYFEENKLKGFVTYKTNNSTAFVGLIAVNPNNQGKGVGAKLLRFLENSAFEKEIKEIIIPTQLSNVQACSFYQKQGYSIKNKTYIKHYWKI